MHVLTSIESRISNSKVSTTGIVVAIFTIGLSLRVFFTPWSIPSSAPDALVYLIETLQFTRGDFSDLGNRFIWPLFLSVFFRFFDFPSYFEYANLMKIVSVVISSSTVFVLFSITKKLVGERLALISAFLFAIEPNIIENSTFAIREPIFLLIGLGAVYFIINKNMRFILLAFVLAAISWDTRINGIAIFFTILISVFIRIREKRQLVKILIIGIPLFLFLSFPYTIVPFEKGQVPILQEIQGVNKIVIGDVVTTATYIENKDNSSTNIVKNALEREFLHLARINFPILIPLAPIGLFFLFRNFTSENRIILVSMIVSYVVAFPIYFLSAEFRNLFFLTPFLCIISSYALQKFSARFQLKNIILVSIFIALTISSIIFLTYRFSVDETLVVEENRFADYIANNYSGNMMGNLYGPISFHLPNAKYGNSSLDEPNIFNDKVGLVVSPIPLDTKDKLLDIIDKRDVNYLIVTNDDDRRYGIFKQITSNEADFPFLEKVFDSEQAGYLRLHVKIFKINQIQ